MCVEERVTVGVKPERGKTEGCSLKAFLAPFLKLDTSLLCFHSTSYWRCYKNSHILGAGIPIYTITHHSPQPPIHMLDNRLIAREVFVLPLHLMQTAVLYTAGLNKCLNISIGILLKIKCSPCNVNPCF